MNTWIADYSLRAKEIVRRLNPISRPADEQANLIQQALAAAFREGVDRGALENSRCACGHLWTGHGENGCDVQFCPCSTFTIPPSSENHQPERDENESADKLTASQKAGIVAELTSRISPPLPAESKPESHVTIDGHHFVCKQPSNHWWCDICHVCGGNGVEPSDIGPCTGVDQTQNASAETERACRTHIMGVNTHELRKTREGLAVKDGWHERAALISFAADELDALRNINNPAESKDTPMPWPKDLRPGMMITARYRPNGQSTTGPGVKVLIVEVSSDSVLVRSDNDPKEHRCLWIMADNDLLSVESAPASSAPPDAAKGGL